jgi:hypothetical protein
MIFNQEARKAGKTNTLARWNRDDVNRLRHEGFDGLT